LLALGAAALVVAAPIGCTAAGEPGAPSASSIAAAAIAATGAAHTGEFTLALRSGDQTVSADGAFRLGVDDRDVRLTLAGLPGVGELRVVLLDESLFVKLPPGQRPVEDKPWLRVPAHGDDAVATRLGPLLDRLVRSVDPATNLEVLRDAATVERLDAETVDGVTTTPYAFTLDVPAAGDGDNTGDGAATAAVRELANQGVTRVGYTVWLDAEHLPRRFELTQAGAAGTVTASGTYSHWGQPVEISPPAAGETVATTG
jgi:hypothetical protein